MKDLRAAELVEAVAQEQIIHNWEAQDSPVHLRTIRDRLLQGDERHRGRLLGLVQTIQEQGGIATDASREQMQLRLTGLVVPRTSQLQITNPIYAAVFSANWVRQQLQELRPLIYGEAIRAWEAASPEERSSYLIRGAPLHEALDWAKGRRLSDADQEFLDASRAAAEEATRAAEATRLAEERALVAELETTRALEQARNRRRWMSGLSAGLVALGGVSAFALVQWDAANKSAEKARVSQQNEKKSAQVADAQKKVAISERIKAIAKASEAEKARNEAVAEKKRADIALQSAQSARKTAEVARRNEADQRKSAVKQASIARQQTSIAQRQTKRAQQRKRSRAITT